MRWAAHVLALVVLWTAQFAKGFKAFWFGEVKRKRRVERVRPPPPPPPSIDSDSMAQVYRAEIRLRRHKSWADLYKLCCIAGEHREISAHRLTVIDDIAYTKDEVFHVKFYDNYEFDIKCVGRLTHRANAARLGQ